jgi:hypothetical protein
MNSDLSSPLTQRLLVASAVFARADAEYSVAYLAWYDAGGRDNAKMSADVRAKMNVQIAAEHELMNAARAANGMKERSR